MAVDVKLWQSRILRAEEYLHQRRQERLQTIKLYTGTYFGSPLSDNQDFSEVNFVYEFCDVLVSSIYARNPKIFVRSNSSRWVAFSETMEQVINIYINRLRLKDKMKSCILDAILQPPGWMNLGYMFLNEKISAKRDIENEFPELKDLNSPEKTESEYGIFDQTAKVDDVFIEHLSSWNVMFPDGYHNIRSSPYMITRQKVTLEDVERNPMFNQNKLRLTGYGASSNNRPPQIFRMNADVKPINMQANNQMDKELINVDLFHVWDRRDMRRFTLARNFYDGVLFEKEWDYLSEGFPQFPLIFNEIPATDEKANAYPLSDIIPMFPQLKELSLLSSAMLRHRKRAGTLLVGQKGVISETDAHNIQNSSDVDLILLPNISEGALRGFTPPALPQDFYGLRDMVLQDLLRISGFQQLLYSAKGIETATESENVRAGSLLRQSRRVDLIEDFTKDIAVYLAGLLWQFKTKKQIEEIIGEPVTDEMWPELPDDITEARRIVQSQLHFHIEAGSTQPPKDEAVERKQWMDLTGSIKANFSNKINDDIYLQQLLKKFDFKDIEKIVVTNDDQEIAAAQEENKLLMQNIPQVVSPNENHMLHLQVHSQVYQTAGLVPTDAMNQHIDSHAKFMEQNNPGSTPQGGGINPKKTSNTPGLSREGVADYSDIIGGIRSQPGTGVNTGG